MASQRQTIGDALGVALKAIKARAVAAFMASRPPARAGTPLDEAEQDALMLKVWQAVAAGHVPTSSDGSVTIGTVKDANGDDQLDLRASLSSPHEFHVGAGCPYSTIQAAINAIRASGYLEDDLWCTVIIHSGQHDADQVYVPGHVGITGVSVETVRVLPGGTGPAFIVDGDDTFFVDFSIIGITSAHEAIRGNNKSRIAIKRMAHRYNDGNNKQPFFVQSGSTWASLAIDQLLISNFSSSGYGIQLTNTSSAVRDVNVEIERLRGDTYSLTAEGGQILLTDVKNVRVRNSALFPHSTTHGRGIRLVKGGSTTDTPDVTIRDVGFRILGESSSIKAFESDAGTSVLLVGGDAPSYVANGSITVVGGGSAGPHAATHAAGGDDALAVTEGMLSLADITIGDLSTSRHGLAPKAPSDATKFLRGDGAWGVPPSTLTAFSTAYEVDFSALAAQNLLTGGSGNKTIDGKTWALANASAWQACYLNDGSHAGIYCRASTANTANDSATLTGGALHAAFSDLAADISNYANWLEAWIWVMYDIPNAMTTAFEYAQCGVISGTAYAAATINRFNVHNGYSNRWGLPVACLAGTQTAGSVTSTTNDVVAIRLVGNLAEMYCGSSSAGAWPSKSAVALRGRAVVANAGMLALDTWRVWLSVVPGNTKGNANVLWKKLRLEYR